MTVSTLIDCIWCGNEFDVTRTTRLEHYSSERCSSCGREHSKDEIKTKMDAQPKPESKKLYLITSKRHFKIGISAKPKERMKEMKTAHPEELSLADVWCPDNAPNVEKKLHAKLSGYNTHGEWFERAGIELQQLIHMINSVVESDC